MRLPELSFRTLSNGLGRPPFSRQFRTAHTQHMGSTYAARNNKGDTMNRLFRIAGLGFAAAALAVVAGAGAAGAATSAPQSAGPVVYTQGWAGYQDGNYQASGRTYRFASTTLTVPPRKVLQPHQDGNGAATILLWGPAVEYAEMSVEPGGGAGTIGWLGSNIGMGSFRVSPKIGDSVTLSIYSDRHGHTYFAAADTTQGTTQTVQRTVDNSPYTTAGFFVNVDPSVTPPDADTLLWQFTGSHVTTSTGVHGTIVGPWTTRKVIETTTGTSLGAVVLSPSRLGHHGQNLSVWLRRR
jgi:hypothetical protein